MKLMHTLVIFAAIFWACSGDSPTSPSVTPPQQQEVIVNVPDDEDSTTARCDAFIKINRRRIPNTNRVRVKVEWEDGKFDRVRVKFLTDDGGIPRFLHIERFISNGTAFEVELKLPQCGVEYKVFVYIEGMKGDAIAAQCDGSVSLTMSCDTPCTDCDDKCIKTERPGDECAWNEAECKWECIPPPCPPQQCGECETWNPTTCACVPIDCPCEPTPKPVKPGYTCTWSQAQCTWECTKDQCTPTGTPECQEQTWDPTTCKWVGTCPCTPVGEKECATQTWDPVKCKWVGDCVCPPVGDSECPEQTWNDKKCKWVGECVDECVPPSERTFVRGDYAQLPGNPATECGIFGAAAGTPAAFYITKCGQFYQLSHDPWLGATCSNGQDVSHSTACKCPEVD